VNLDPADHVGLAHHLARRFHADDPDALAGEALLAIVRAAPDYDPTKGTPAAFLGTAIRFALYTEIERQRERPPTVSLVVTNRDGEERFVDVAVEDPAPAQFDTRRDVEKILGQLPSRDAALLRSRFGLDGEPLSLEAIGAALGRSSARAGQLVVAALGKAQRAARRRGRRL
jgi:RNA polymerase sigma factor (sigma-70 family)